jgi:Zn-dependent protease
MSQQPTPPLQSGSMLLFRVAGISVFVHWSWLIVAYFEISYRSEFPRYDSLIWFIVEYLALFGIVILHEFGHALACRQVGGKADYIVLWPLGGVAFVAPPPRPGAVLWSIAAGPLVNVALVPVTIGAYLMSRQAGWPDDYPNLARLIYYLTLINGMLLVFNLLPVYPLDGGQILQALLWFVIGQATASSGADMPLLRHGAVAG